MSGESVYISRGGYYRCTDGFTYCSSVFYAVCFYFYTPIFLIFSILLHHIYYTKYFVTDDIIKGSSKTKKSWKYIIKT